MKSTKTPAYEKFLLNIISLREAAGLTQLQVARAQGKHQPFVSKVESGERRLDLVEFVAWCKAISADPIELLETLVDQLNATPISKGRKSARVA